MSLHDKLTIGIDIAKAIGQLNDCGYCQRDVKPGNIMLRKIKGRYRGFLGDFNLASSLGKRFSRKKDPYFCWDSATNRNYKFPATSAVDLYGLARTLAETFFPEVTYQTDLEDWRLDPSDWSNHFIRTYAINKLEQANCAGYAIVLEKAQDPIYELESWIYEGDIFRETYAEAKILKEIFNVVEDLLNCDKTFAETVRRNRNPVAYAKRVFDSPWKYHNKLFQIRLNLEKELCGYPSINSLISSLTTGSPVVSPVA